MKRSQDQDADASSTIKRAATPSRDNPSGQTPAATAGPTTTSNSQKLADNAIAYLKKVRGILQDEGEKYNEFIELMKDFKGKRIETPEVVERVNELFSEHPDLVVGFKIFLPEQYEVFYASDEDESPPKKKNTLMIDEAFNLVNEVKNRFQDDDHVFRSFIDILISFRKERKSNIQVYEEVASLFEGHDDLLEEYVQFFPKSLPDTSSGSEGQESDEQTPSGSEDRESDEETPSGSEGRESDEQTPSGSEKGKGGGEI